MKIQLIKDSSSAQQKQSEQRNNKLLNLKSEDNEYTGKAET